MPEVGRSGTRLWWTRCSARSPLLEGSRSSNRATLPAPNQSSRYRVVGKRARLSSSRRALSCHPSGTRTLHAWVMNYIIGSGAILEAGRSASITPACLHAHVDASLAHTVKAAAVDFESTGCEAISRLLVFIAGGNAASFRALVTRSASRCADLLAGGCAGAACPGSGLHAGAPFRALASRPGNLRAAARRRHRARGSSAREHRGGLRGCRAALPALASGLECMTQQCHRV